MTASTSRSRTLTRRSRSPAAPPETFAVTGPTSGTYAAGSSVGIQWTAGNVVAGSKISLCYDSDATFNGNEHWIEIDGVAAANSGGTYTWNTAGVAPGTYYLAGYMYDGKHFTISHLDQAITITAGCRRRSRSTAPTSGSYVVGDSVGIQWTAGGVVSGSKISLCYDTDTTSTATSTGSKSTAWRPPTAAARTPGTPPAWRRARTTSPATCTTASTSRSRT